MALAGSACLALAACGSSGGASTGSVGPGGVLEVVASFYPLQFVTEVVGGDRVTVRNMTPAGAEPHDLELTPQDAAALSDADLIVYLGGFAPAVDAAVAAIDPDAAFDVAPSARLDLELDPAAGTDGRVGGDPHFWLDPLRLADVADAVATRLTELDPTAAATFVQHAATLRDQLVALDGEYRAGLEDCASTDLVTSHAAFGYLAQRYRLHQVGIADLSPEEEPSPAKLAEVARFVDDHGVATIYYETLVDPAIARTVAAETGAATAVLDPIEGLAAGSDGDDYFGVMRSNLAHLRAGQGCR